MTKKTIRKIFIILIIYLPVQYLLVAVSGYLYESEPWPAFVFPGFKSVHHFAGKYQLDRTHFEIEIADDESEVIVVRPQQFFHDIPNQSINGFMRTVFSGQENVDQFSPETLKWLKERAEQQTGSDDPIITLYRFREFATREGSLLHSDSIAVYQVISISHDGVLYE